MLNHITWTQYLCGILALTFIYYTWIVIRFYRQDLRARYSGKKNTFLQPLESPATEHQLPDQVIADQTITATQNGEKNFDRIESLIGELKSQIHQKQGGTGETGLLEKLRTVIHAYPDLKDSPFRTSINEMIISECQLVEISPPDETELQQLW